MTLIERLEDRATSYDQCGPSGKHTADLLREAAAALLATRNQALEEAAQEADKRRTKVIGNDEWEGGRNDALADVSVAIRSLISGKASGQQTKD